MIIDRYAGTKQRSGSPVAKAGLTNGDDHVLDAVNQAVSTDAQWRTTYGKGVPAAVRIVENEWNATGAVQNSTGKADGLNLSRIEDGHWDPNHPNDFYFVTTQGGVTGGTASTPSTRAACGASAGATSRTPTPARR